MRVVVTTFDLDEYEHGPLRGGACGFLLKDSGPTLLAEAVRGPGRWRSLERAGAGGGPSPPVMR